MVGGAGSRMTEDLLGPRAEHLAEIRSTEGYEIMASIGEELELLGRLLEGKNA